MVPHPVHAVGGLVGKTRRRLAAELVGDLEQNYARRKAADKVLKSLVAATGTSLLDLNGIGPSGAARLLLDVADMTHFPDRNHFASWTGTAAIDASAGDRVRHRLSRGGNRQINRVYGQTLRCLPRALGGADVHVQAVGAAVDLRDADVDELDQRSRKPRFFRRPPHDPVGLDLCPVSVEAHLVDRHPADVYRGGGFRSHVNHPVRLRAFVSRILSALRTSQKWCRGS
jgi:hypothetical protein